MQSLLSSPKSSQNNIRFSVYRYFDTIVFVNNTKVDIQNVRYGNISQTLYDCILCVIIL